MSEASFSQEEESANLINERQSNEQDSLLKWFLGIVSIPLFTTGCPIIEVNDLAIKSLQYFVMFWFFWTGFYRIFDFIDFALYKANKFYILYSIYLYSRVGMIMVTTMLFLFKKYRILDFVEKLWLELETELQKKLVWTTSIAICISFGLRILKTVWWVFTFNSDNHYIWPNQIKEFFVAFVNRDIFACYVVIYLLFVLLLKKYIINGLIRLQDNLAEPSKEMDCIHIQHQLEKMLQNNREFEEIFSLLPFLWVLYNFISASATFYAPVWPPMRTVSNLRYVFVFNNFCVFAMILFVCHTRKSVKEAINKTRSLFVINRNLTNNSCETVTAIHRNMDILSALQFTAWDIFSLEKAVILSFTGTVMTFTVLFIKLSKETIT